MPGFVTVAQMVVSPIGDPEVMRLILVPPGPMLLWLFIMKYFSTPILLLPLIQEGLLSGLNKSMYTEYLLTNNRLV